MRLLAMYLRLTGVFVVLIMGAVVTARAQPAENAIAALGLQTCAGIPCLLGITPAFTAWSDAPKYLTDLYAIKYERADTVLVGERGDDRIYIYPDAAMNVRRVIYTPLGSKPIAGDLVRMFGTPCSFLIETSNYVSLTYPHMQVYVAFVNGRVSMQSPVLTVTLYSTDLSLRCFPDKWRAWVGFMHRYSYMRRWPKCLGCLGSVSVQ